MKNSFFYAEILNTDCTLNSIKISKKSKICNMPKMAPNGPKWPKIAKYDLKREKIDKTHQDHNISSVFWANLTVRG